MPSLVYVICSASNHVGFTFQPTIALGSLLSKQMHGTLPSTYILNLILCPSSYSYHCVHIYRQAAVGALSHPSAGRPWFLLCCMWCCGLPIKWTPNDSSLVKVSFKLLGISRLWWSICLCLPFLLSLFDFPAMEFHVAIGSNVHVHFVQYPALVCQVAQINSDNFFYS